LFEELEVGKMKNVLMILATIAVVPLAVWAQETREVTGAEDLVKEKGKFKETWLQPGLDMSKYSKLYLWEGAFDFRDVSGPSAGATGSILRSGSGPYKVREESKQKFEQVVGEAFAKELNRSKLFDVVDKVGPNTLLVRGAMADIVSYVPPNFTGTSEVYLSAVGEATFVFELIDAETGVVQARVAERRRIQPPGRMHEVSAYPANANTVWMDVERWARQVAQDLRKELEKAKKKASE